MEKTGRQMAEDIREIAVRTGVFNASEIGALVEIMESYAAEPDRDYSLVTVEDGPLTCGFIVYGRTPFTRSGWDLYWLAVDPEFQGRGIGKKLMEVFEARLRELSSDQAVVRVETSSRDEYASARKLYLKCGYYHVGRIKNFYAPGDDLMLYGKELS